ncbi:MAG TPA: SBBP repeat-containing protein [Chloroflexia bacterium]|nr:SBBP repeat-containing protein [Chloroflexia bacterium]
MLLQTPHPATYKRIVLVVALAGLLLGISFPLKFWSGDKVLPADRTINPARLALAFEPNVGQADPEARYLVHSSGNTLLFTQSRVVLALPVPGEKGVQREKHPIAANQPRRKSAASALVSLNFVGAESSPEIVSQEMLPGKVNYLLGNDPSAWHTDLPTYTGISYRGLYPGVDLTYSGSDGLLKGTYSLAAGADPSLIRWRYDGAKQLSVDAQGNLQITLNSVLDPQSSALTITEQAPIAWQEIDGQRVPVSVRYALDAGTIGFVVGSYDATRPLTIDPTLTYSTYLGGFYGDGAADIAVDAQGNMYVTGSTMSSDFPTAGNPFQPVWGGAHDAFVTKLSPDGSTIIYSTFLGGSGEINGGEFPRFISVDASGNVIIAGSTDSDDFPTTPDAYQIIYAGTGDLFITKLNSTGSDLIFSTYYGDAGVEEPGGFVVDGAGNTYFTGYTFPGFSSYVIVGGISADGSQLLFARMIGGQIPGPGNENANSAGGGIALDSAGNIYLTGYTRAADFPVTPGAYRTSLQAFEDGFVTKLNPTGQTILYSTFINGGVSEYMDDITVDGAGNAYITGNTSSADYPTTPGAFQTVKGDPRIAFVTKLNPAGSDLVYSTFLGDDDFNFDPEDYGFAIRVNGAGSAYVVGYTSSPGFPVSNPLQATMNGPYDAFITKFNPAGSALDFSTFLGGTGGDVADSIVVDTSGNMYVVGGTSSTNFPVVNAVQPTNHGDGDAFIIKISDPQGAVSPTPTRTGTPPTATPSSSPTACAPSPDYVFHRFFGATLVPGTLDIGNHCEDCLTSVILPFPVHFYGQTYTTANISSNGNIQFLSNDETGLTECGPFAFFNYAIMPYQADLNTEGGGVYTSISGTAPNRIFNVEWRACVYDPLKFTCDENVNFEARLYENSPTEQIDFIYAQVDSFGGIPAVVALQESTGTHYKEFSCNADELEVGMKIEFTRGTCAITTATPVGTPPTATITRTATATPNPCNNVTPWRTETPMLTPYSRSVVAVHNNQLYVIGGASNSPTPVPFTQKFDPASNSWTNHPPVPNGVTDNGAVTIGDKIYVMGSTYQPSEVFMQIYDIATSTWSRGATLPEPLLSGALAEYNNKIYIFGGQPPVQPPTTHVYEYNPATDTFTQKASMPTGQAEIGAGTIGNRIYVVGGYQYVHYAYDPIGNSWTTIAMPPTPSFSHPGVFVLNGELWVEGGYDNPSRHGYPPSQEVQIYNPVTNSWRFGPAFNTPRYFSTAAGVINGRGYVVGGVDLESNSYPYNHLSSMESIGYVQCGTPTPIATGATATRTATLPPQSTSTATGTAGSSTTSTPTIATTSTPCAINFSDVPADNTFYSFVRCLACRGIISGYSDGTFRPNNDITRGQIAKIVSNSAGFSDDPGPQVYEDVPIGSPFYVWINRLSNRGYMGGYLCGLIPEEPCIPPDNRPYFRPNASATRGQLAKIVSNAAGLVGNPTGLFYTDVAEDHPFYVWIMRLTTLGVMSGYPCGSEGEPCDGGNHPYFRPFNNVTRGQASKIVANTFFPNCQTPTRP